MLPSVQTPKCKTDNSPFNEAVNAFIELFIVFHLFFSRRVFLWLLCHYFIFSNLKKEIKPVLPVDL